MEHDTPEPNRASGHSTAVQHDRINISADDFHGLLANERRRSTIELVAELEPDDHISLSRLARCIAFIEGDHDGPEDVGHAARKSVYVALYQHHLKQLVDTNVIGWDDRENIIWPTPLTPVVAEEMESIGDRLGDGDSSDREVPA